MNLRNKLLLVFIALAFAPLVLVGLINYRSGVGAVGDLLGQRAGQRADRVTHRVERILDTRGSRLLELADGNSLRAYVRDSQAARASAGGAQTASGVRPASAAPPPIPDTAKAHIGAFFKNNREYLESIVCLDASGGPPLFRVPDAHAAPGDEPTFQTSDFVSREVRYDKQVWSLARPGALRSPVTEESGGAVLRITVPVYAPAGDAIIGALVAEVRLKEIVEDAAEAETAVAAPPGAATAANTRPDIVALDNATGFVVYHTNGAFAHQPVSSALPYFEGVAASMRAGASGSDFYYEPGGMRRLVAFRQVDSLNVSLAVAEDYTAAVGPVRRSGLIGVLLALAAGLAALALLLFIARRATLDIERVASAASAIAAGDIGRHIEPGATAETRALAESFNKMSDRLRGLILKEAESRQFQSFLRISAMISHDLKNAIAGLSMLVTNMEKRFHREEFRADAIESLREATEKLKRTVARLSEPAKSLSGEYRMAARATDLVPVFRRVLATVAEPSRPLYEVEARLPETLTAWVEAGRVENVFENLVINALEAMGAKGGTLSVEAGQLEGGFVFFSVADTGVGMTEEFIKERLFRPFSTTKMKGIGLGLFTCREVVEAHGGKLEVESHVGVGTRFRVVLPSHLFKSGERRGQPGKATAAVEKTGPGASV